MGGSQSSRVRRPRVRRPGVRRPGVPLEISLKEARRYALQAQGFDQPRLQRAVTAPQIAKVIRKLGLVQLDFVNVVGPAHYQVIFSRLGQYDRALLDDLIYRSGEFTEQWAHEASIIPVETWPLLRWRMATFHFRPWGFEKVLEKNPGYADSVLEALRERGALLAEDLHIPEGAARIPGAWYASVTRATLEAHFARGLVAIANRRPGFARVYDLAERVIAAEHHAAEVLAEEAQRRLLAQSARGCGVGTAADLADYFRMKVGEAKPRIAELVEAGELREVRVEGWRETAYIHRDTKTPPKAIAASALLSPFDPLIWFRPRLLRLFQFDYRFEIFVPEPKRKWGCYVLPFLNEGRLVARVDLKADRASRRLRVVSRRYERACKRPEIVAALDAELHAMSKFWM